MKFRRGCLKGVAIILHCSKGRNAKSSVQRLFPETCPNDDAPSPERPVMVDCVRPRSSSMSPVTRWLDVAFGSVRANATTGARGA